MSPMNWPEAFAVAAVAVCVFGTFAVLFRTRIEPIGPLPPSPPRRRRLPRYEVPEFGMGWKVETRTEIFEPVPEPEGKVSKKSDSSSDPKKDLPN